MIHALLGVKYVKPYRNAMNVLKIIIWKIKDAFHAHSCAKFVQTFWSADSVWMDLNYKINIVSVRWVSICRDLVLN